MGTVTEKSARKKKTTKKQDNRKRKLSRKFDDLNVIKK